MNTTLNPMVLNTNATKHIQCPGSCKSRQEFTINAGAWCCRGCGWVIELTESEKKKHTFKSSTFVLANYLMALGYPVVHVVREHKDADSKLMAGTVFMIDTNPTQDPRRNRRVLEVGVETYGNEVSYQFEATKYTLKGKRTGGTTYMCDDLLKLGDDIQTQYEIADLAVNTLGLDMKHHPHFDVKELELKLEVADAVYRLNEADAALAKYQKGGRKTK